MSIFRKLFRRPAKCNHEWIVGEPAERNYYKTLDKYPAVCRWCAAREVLSHASAHHFKEWQRMELERTRWPGKAGDV